MAHPKKVYFLRFKMDGVPAFSTRDLMDVIAAQTNHKVEYPSHGYDRVIAVDNTSSLHLIFGVMVTFFAADDFLSYNRSNGRLGRSTIADELAVTNFFILSKLSSSGIYMNYRGSVGINNFTRILNTKFREYKAIRKGIALAGLRGQERKRAEAQFHDGRRQNLSTTLVYSARDYKELLREAEEFLEVEIEIGHEMVFPQSSRSGTLSRSMAKESLKVIFEKHYDKKWTKAAIHYLIKRFGEDNFKVKAIMDNDNPEFIRRMNMVARIDDVDYDDIVGDLEIDTNSISGNPIFQNMQELSEGLLDFH